MFTDAFRGGKRNESPESTATMMPIGYVFGRIAFLAFLGAFPFGIIWLFYLTSERGIPFYDRFNNWEWSKPAQIDRSAQNASEAYLNVLEMEGGLYQLEDAGKRLWGPRHTWQVSGFQPDWTPEDFEGRISHPNFSVAWEERVNETNREFAEEVLSNYAYTREFYSRSKFVVDQLLSDSRSAARGLPDEATILRTLDNLKVYSDTQFAVRDIERVKGIFETKIAPFFLAGQSGYSGKVYFFGFATLLSFLIAAGFHFAGRKSRKPSTLAPSS